MLKTITSTANTVGSLEYKGLWNAATNTPTLVSSVGTQGDYYVVSVAGTTNLDGVTTWDEGDWAIFNGSVWQLFQDGQDGVFATLTVSNYAAFADNAKATFGTGAGDLQIYHDGSDSYIDDVGTGNLLINADSLRLQDTTVKRWVFYLLGNDGAVVRLYTTGSTKLATTATGIDITGTATMDGLTVSKTFGSIVRLESTGTGPGAGVVIGDLQFYGNDASAPGAGIKASITATTVAALGDDSQLMFSTSDGTTNNVNRMLIANNGDVSLYEDTGTTPKFVWDSSAESLGLNNINPSATYSVDAAKGIRVSAAAPSFTLQETDAANQSWLMASYGGTFAIRDTTVAGTAYPFQIEAATPSNTLYLDSTGSVGIGTSTPAQAKLDILMESDYSSHTGHGLSILSNAANAYTSLYIGTDDTIDSAYIQSAGKNTSFTSKKLLLNPNGGNVGIGTDSPGSKVTISDPGTGIGLINAASGNFNIGLLAGTGSPNAYIFQRANAPLLFGTNNAERARLTSDGDFLAGTTDAAPWLNGTNTSSDNGIAARADGILAASAYKSTANSGNVAIFNRTGTDGPIQSFYKSGTTVGIIGNNTDFYIASQDGTGLRFTSNQVLPCSESGAIQNGSRDLGSSSGRFKDLYLSGGVVFGTTGGSVSSKTLDDYETGTFTPVMTGVSGWSGSSGVDGNYTKIGNIVHVFISMTSNVALTGTASYTITGLPFAANLNERCANVSISRMFGIGLTTTDYIAGVAGSQIEFGYVNGDNNNNNFTHSGSTLRFTLSATYTTAA
jgi:hypothetical protein